MQLSAIDLNLLVVLQALLQTESVKATSTRLGLSPSAVSHALARLRDTLDDPLLVRAGQRLTMTPRARALRPELDAALELLQRSLTPDAPFDPSLERREFVVATTDHVELSLLLPLGTRLREVAPGIDLHSRAPRPQSADMLRNGDADLGVGVLRNLPDDIAHEVLFQEHFVTLMRHDHPARRGPWNAKRYANLDHVLVAPGGRPHGLLDTKLEALGLKRRIARMVSTFLVAPFLVQASDLVVTLPSKVATPLADQLGLACRPPPKALETIFEVAMAWHRRDDNDPAHRWLREQVRNVAT